MGGETKTCESLRDRRRSGGLTALRSACGGAVLLLCVQRPAAAQGVSPTPASAAPAPAGRDLIRLRDGSTIEGTAAPTEDGSAVTIVLSNGRARVIPWSEIVMASGPAFADGDTAPAPAPASPVAGIDYTQPASGRYRLVVESTGGPLRVAVHRGESSAGSALCVTPCTLFAPPGDVPLLTTATSGETVLTHAVVTPPGLRVRIADGHASFARILPVVLGVGVLAAGLAMTVYGAVGNVASEDGILLETFGGLALSAGVAIMVVGMLSTAPPRTGLVWAGPVASRVSPARWQLRLGAGPIPGGGGIVTAALTF